MVRAFDSRKLMWVALLLLALLPTQLAIETGIAYFVLPRQESAVLKIADNQVQVDHVRYVLPSIPLSTFTWHLLRVTAFSFIAGLVLLVLMGVRCTSPVRSSAMRMARWILLPVAVLVTTVSAALLFLHIERAVVEACAQHYDLDVDICPAPWAVVVSSVLACVGSAAASAFAVLSAYAAAPAARVMAMRATAVLLTCFAIWLAFVHWSWQLLFAVGAAFGVTFLMARRDARLPEPSNQAMQRTAGRPAF